MLSHIIILLMMLAGVTISSDIFLLAEKFRICWIQWSHATLLLKMCIGLCFFLFFYQKQQRLQQLSGAYQKQIDQQKILSGVTGPVQASPAVAAAANAPVVATQAVQSVQAQLQAAAQQPAVQTPATVVAVTAVAAGITQPVVPVPQISPGPMSVTQLTSQMQMPAIPGQVQHTQQQLHLQHQQMQHLQMQQQQMLQQQQRMMLAQQQQRQQMEMQQARAAAVARKQAHAQLGLAVAQGTPRGLNSRKQQK